jgi:hypothetical protein
MNEDRLKHLLKTALPPVHAARPRRDLWPAMRARIDEATLRVSLFDWALLAAVIAWVVIEPLGALSLLYHL